LVIELSLSGTPALPPGNHNGSLRFGSDGAGGDLPENDTETGTTFNPWLEFANDISFEGTTPATDDLATGGKGDNPPAKPVRRIVKPTGLDFRKYKEKRVEAPKVVPDRVAEIATAVAKQKELDDYAQVEAIYAALEKDNIEFQWKYLEYMLAHAQMMEAARKSEEDDTTTIIIIAGAA